MCENGKVCESARKQGVTERQLAYYEERAETLTPLFHALTALVAEYKVHPRDVAVMAAFCEKWADSMSVDDSEGMAALGSWVHITRMQPFCTYDEETGQITSVKLRSMVDVSKELEAAAEAEFRANVAKAAGNIRMATIKLPRDIAEGIAEAMGVTVPPKDPDPVH